MELAQFIKATLLEIRQGLQEANMTIHGDQAPGRHSFMLAPGSDKSGGTGIHFDVAVTTTHDSTSGGNPRVRVADVEISGNDGNKVKNEHISRIVFTVRVEQWIG